MISDPGDRPGPTRARAWWNRAIHGSRLSLWPWVPMGMAAVYAVIFLATVRSLVTAIYLFADATAGPVLGELIGRAPPGSQIVLGNIPWFPELWFEQLTHGLPFHRQIWELTPWALGVIGIGAVGWATARLTRRWSGWLVTVTCVCAGATLLPLQFGWSIHAVSYFHICLLSALVVPIALAPGWIGGRPWRHAGLLTGAAVVTGLGIASDELVVIGGLVPFAIAGASLAYVGPPRRRWPTLGSVSSVILGAVVIAVIVTHLAHDEGLSPAAFSITFSPFNQLLYHVGDLLGSLAELANGNFNGAGLSLTSAIALLSATGVMFAVYAVLRTGRTTVLALRARRTGSLAEPTRRDAGRIAFLAFWLACAAAVSLAFILSSVPVGIFTSRYVVPVGYALIVIVTMAAEDRPGMWRRVLLVAGSSAVIAGSILSLAQRQIQHINAPSGATASKLLRYARANGLTVGYSGYWDATPLMWELHFALQIYPLTPCGPNLCQFPYHKISSWYSPHPVRRSFLVSDSALATSNGFAGPPAGLGPPIRQTAIGQLTVYVYPYDIATKLAG